MTSSKPTRRERQAIVRARRRERRHHGVRCQLRPGCPKPGKKAYPTNGDAAVEGLRVSAKSGRTLVAYRCDCGAWHLAGLDRWQIRQRAIASGRLDPG